MIQFLCIFYYPAVFYKYICYFRYSFSFFFIFSCIWKHEKYWILYCINCIKRASDLALFTNFLFYLHRFIYLLQNSCNSSARIYLPFRFQEYTRYDLRVINPSLIRPRITLFAYSLIVLDSPNIDTKLYRDLLYPRVLTAFIYNAVYVSIEDQVACIHMLLFFIFFPRIYPLLTLCILIRITCSKIYPHYFGYNEQQ